MPLLVAGAGYLLWRSIGRTGEAGGRDWLPFLLTLIIFALSMIGLAISIWPDVVPGRVTIWEAAAPERSQVLMLVGAGILVPILFCYTNIGRASCGERVVPHVEILGCAVDLKKK